MKLLFLSNLYPPYGQGGYEQWCQEVAGRLRAGGHDIRVLTGRPPHGKLQRHAGEPYVYRELYPEMESVAWRNGLLFFTERARREAADLACLRRHTAEFAPDALLIWGMWNMPRSLPALAEQLYPRRSVYYFGDYWPSLPSQWCNYWRVSARSGFSFLPKRLLRPIAERILSGETRPALCLARGLFPTEFMARAYAEAGVHVGASQVIPGGVCTATYVQAAQRRGLEAPGARGPLRLLVAGRLIPDKGIHTAVEALGIMARTASGRPGGGEDCVGAASLTVVGAGTPEYTAQLTAQIRDLGLEGRVHLMGAVPQEQMPSVYAGHDIFLFPSRWPEPFGRVLVEAMAAKMAVIGTTVGGAGEILRDGETGLTFPPDDPAALARQIGRLAGDAALWDRLASAGQARAVACFDSAAMAESIERYMAAVVEGA